MSTRRTPAEDPPTTEAELRASEELNRRIIEAMPAGIVQVSIDGTIQKANEAALKVLGLSYDEVTSRYTQDFEPDTIWEDGTPCLAVDYPVTHALTTGEAQEPVTIGVRRPDGGVSWSLYTAVPVSDPETGATTSAVVTILDITHRKEEEQARRALEGRLLFTERMAAVGTLAAGVAHEVNNPLTYVLANLQEARDSELGQSPEFAALLSEALEGARRIQHVVAELGSFARGDTGEHAVLLGEVVHSALRLTRSDLRHRARLITDIDPQLAVKGGRSKLGQLFLNLIINALQAIPLGAADTNEIRIAAHEAEGLAHITVRDTGVGVPAHLIGSIFDPFVTSKKQGVGSGLGLYVSHTIVHGLGGQMLVQSTEGEGTTFLIELPIADSIEAPRPSEAPLAVPDDADRSVLIVDDEPVVRAVLRRTFKTWDVSEAAGGREALELLAKRTFDVVLCDLMMPHMTGMELYEKARVRFPELTDRFVFITGAAYTEDAGEFVELVGRPVLNKPFRRSELLAVVRQAAEGASRND